MNKTLITWFTATIIGAASGRGQSVFQNLDFEAARNLPGSDGSAAATNVLPGWSAFSGTNQLTTIPYNMASAVPKVGLYGPPGIGGNFDVVLNSGGSINQTGVVPTNAASLLFKGYWTSLSPVGAFLGGHSLSYTAIATGPNYTLYDADISIFAGQTASLTFLAAARDIYAIDDIQFSPQAVPEPATLAFLGLGGFFITTHLLRRRRSKPSTKTVIVI